MWLSADSEWLIKCVCTAGLYNLFFTMAFFFNFLLCLFNSFSLWIISPSIWTCDYGKGVCQYDVFDVNVIDACLFSRNILGKCGHYAFSNQSRLKLFDFANEQANRLLITNYFMAWFICVTEIRHFSMKLSGSLLVSTSPMVKYFSFLIWHYQLFAILSVPSSNHHRTRIG